jgi:hypothetical protein
VKARDHSNNIAPKFEVSSDGLTLHGDLYGRRIPREKLRPEGVRVVDLERDAALVPVRRTLGTGLPGYQARS